MITPLVLTTLLPIIELTHRQAVVLAILRQSQKAMTATDIGRRAGLTPKESSARVGPILSQFVADGLASKEAKNARVITYTAIMSGQLKDAAIKIVERGRKPAGAKIPVSKLAKLPGPKNVAIEELLTRLPG